VLDLSVFYNHIYDYIYLSPTNDTTPNGIDIYRYEQNSANLYGVEFAGEYNFNKILKMKGTYSHITAQQQNGENLPFIPQDKIRLTFLANKNYNSKTNNIEIGISPLFAFAQNNPHIFETNTDNYFIMNGFFNISFSIFNSQAKAGVYVSNLFNTAYYDHLSTLKELGYYNMGRNIGFSLKVSL
jgi:iron complex outermembrane receptor protein